MTRTQSDDIDDDPLVSVTSYTLCDDVMHVGFLDFLSLFFEGVAWPDLTPMSKALTSSNPLPQQFFFLRVLKILVLVCMVCRTI